jgi:hypothetical protein
MAVRLELSDRAESTVGAIASPAAVARSAVFSAFRERRIDVCAVVIMQAMA